MKRLLPVSVLFVDLLISSLFAFPDDFLPFMGVNGTHFANAENPDFRFVGINLDPWRFLVQKGPDAMRNWLKDMGKAVRSIDGRHLVTVGIGGAENAWWRSGSANWAALKVKEIDFLDLHYYADAALYDPVDGKNAAEIRDRIKAGLAIGKPVVFGEFGCANTKPDTIIGKLYATILGSLFELGGSGGMPYSWGPPGPNGWGGRGSFCLYSDRTEVCSELLGISGVSAVRPR